MWNRERRQQVYVELCSGMPLVARELTEMSARRSTYLCRSIFAVGLNLVGFAVVAETLFDSNPLRILGRGRSILEAIVYTEFFGIYVLFPFMAAGVVTDEKEKDSLQLLLITRLGPWRIILEKLISRLIPMVSLLAISTPLFAIAYSLGGFSSASLIAAIWTLFLACFQVASLGLLCSTISQKTTHAYLATVGFGAAIIFIPVFVNEMRIIRLGNELMMFPPAIFDWFTWRSAESLFEQSLPLLLLCVAAVLASRMLLLPFATGAVLTPIRSLTHWLDHSLTRASEMRRRQLTRVNVWLASFRAGMESSDDPSDLLMPVPYGEPPSLDDDHHQTNADSGTGLDNPSSFDVGHQLDAIGMTPVAWRESRFGVLTRPRFRAGFIVAITLLVVLSMMSIWGSHPDDELAILHFGFLSCLALAVVVRSASLFSSERSRQTLDILLSTPLSNRTILNQKLSGVRELTLLFAIPWVILLSGEILIREQFTVRYFSRREFPYLWYEYLGGWLMMVPVYLYMLVWLGTLVGLMVRRQVHALMWTLGLIFAWSILPLFVLILIFESVGVSPRDEWAQLLLLSPMTGLVLHEFNGFDEIGGAPVRSLAINSLLYLGWGILLRFVCVKRLDRMLGRTDTSAALSGIQRR